MVALREDENIPHGTRKLDNKGVPKDRVTNTRAGTAFNACCEKWIWKF